MKKSGGVDVVRLVQADLEARVEAGRRLNGRRALQDLYEELLDACCYLKQLLEEMRQERSRILKELEGKSYGGGAPRIVPTEEVNRMRRLMEEE